MSSSLTLTENQCLLKCQEEDLCQWYSFRRSSYECILLTECTFIDSTCTDCVFGEKACKALPGKRIEVIYLPKGLRQGI